MKYYYYYYPLLYPSRPSKLNGSPGYQYVLEDTEITLTVLSSLKVTTVSAVCGSPLLMNAEPSW